MDTGGPTSPKKARIRLRSLSVHAVALVPDGANLLRWAEVRKEGTMGIEGGEATTAKTLTLPKAAQEGIAAGLTQAIEALSALLEMCKGAQVTEDRAAVVPPEFTEQIERVGMMIAALGDQYDTAAAPPIPEGEAAMALAPENMALVKMVSKALAVKFIASAAKVSKGRVKMSFEQMMKLHSGLLAKLYDIANELAPLIGDAGSAEITASLPAADAPAEGATAKGAPAIAAAAPPPPPGQSPPAAGTQAPAATPGLQAQLDRLEKAMTDLTGTVNRVAKTRVPSNVVPAQEPPAAPPPHTINYGANYSAIVKQEQAAADAAVQRGGSVRDAN